MHDEDHPGDDPSDEDREGGAAEAAGTVAEREAVARGDDETWEEPDEPSP